MTTFQPSASWTISLHRFPLIVPCISWKFSHTLYERALGLRLAKSLANESHQRNPQNYALGSMAFNCSTFNTLCSTPCSRASMAAAMASLNVSSERCNCNQPMSNGARQHQRRVIMVWCSLVQCAINVCHSASIFDRSRVFQYCKAPDGNAKSPVCDSEYQCLGWAILNHFSQLARKGCVWIVHAESIQHYHMTSLTPVVFCPLTIRLNGFFVDATQLRCQPYLHR